VTQGEVETVQVVDEPLPAREELVAEVHEVLGDEPAVERTRRVVDALHGEIALEHARRFSAQVPVRTPFTVAERDAADWIVAELHAIGLPEEDVHLQTFGTKSLDGHARSELRTVREDTPLEQVQLSQNVVARLHGAGAGVVVVGAHYDSVQTADQGDNATGVLGAEEHELDLETGEATSDEVGTAILETATGLDNGLRPFLHGIFAAGANLPFTYAGLRVLNLSAITGQFLERPSLADGHFHPGQVQRHEHAAAQATEAREEILVAESDGDAQTWAFTREVVPGRQERALYVYGTFLETLLLGFPS